MTTLYDENNNKIGAFTSFNVVNGIVRDVVLADGKIMHFGPGEVTPDDYYNLYIRKKAYKVLYDYSRWSTEQAKKNDIVRFGMCNVSIRKVIFNDPATIVLWSDGSKTVVKCGPEDTYDMEKGLAMAIVKKMAGNDNRFHKVFKQYPKKKKKEPGSVGSIMDMMAGLNQAAAIATKTVRELAHMAAVKAERGE
mgnify:FL=1|jgi:hypothetical protein